MIQRSRERAVLVGLDLREKPARGKADIGIIDQLTPEESLEELRVLSESAGADVLGTYLQKKDVAESSTLIGSGKVDEIRLFVQTAGIDLVLFDRDLTPTQQRNLERTFDCAVVDRTQLILDIFASRARTREGQLQVELAQLNYLLPRLAGRGTQMSRLGGGIGTRGPGETQLETDRRRIFRRVRKIESDLESVRAGRGIQRRQRQSVPLATIGIVGYTNAGKSSLFNRLTGAGVLADARMFATLDPTVRQLSLPSNRKVLLSDTVGFIRNLPTTLVKSFRATLEEVVEAALLLHVVDSSSPYAAHYVAQVSSVLAEIKAESTPQVLILNKIDLLEQKGLSLEAVCGRVLGNVAADAKTPSAIGVSARTGQGLPELLAHIDSLMPLDPLSISRFRFPHDEQAARHRIHENARVLEQTVEEGYTEIVAQVPESTKSQLRRFLVTSDSSDRGEG